MISIHLLHASHTLLLNCQTSKGDQPLGGGGGGGGGVKHVLPPLGLLTMIPSYRPGGGGCKRTESPPKSKKT